ncbi:hypothetical protein Agub_g3235 [Astrephomene gubernaculifera]|uniref:Ribosomal protein L16 n=1 Tax=Astrephomene gubernaculifera TaxID=47775 RepID=A0AAD3DIU3_9CHLO|nr:hypothetical protein Agub_g3235 [Astrephomene gubernaculifera]
MQAWCRVFRAALGQGSVARGLSRSHSLVHQCDSQLGTCSRAAKTLELAEAPSSSGRSITTLAGRLGSAAANGLSRPLSASPALLGESGLRPVSALHGLRADAPLAAPGSIWGSLMGQVRWCQKGQPSRQRVPKRMGINDVIMPNTTQLKFGLYGIRALSGKRVAANTIEAVRRTLRRKIKKTARLWIRIAATVPVTRKPIGIRMGKGKGSIDFYATPVRPGQIIFEMDRVPRKVALQALQAAQYKFPVKLGFVEWS